MKYIRVYFIKCAGCGLEKWYTHKDSRGGKRTVCSIRCVNLGRKHTEERKKILSESMKGEKNHFYGKTHTIQTIEKLKNINKTSTQRFKTKIGLEQYALWLESHSKKCSGVLNGFYGKKHTEETKKRMSESKANKIAEGKINLKYPRGTAESFDTKNNNTEFCDSFYEYVYMKFLDSQKNISWTKKHKIKIPYEFENKNKFYVPDFLVEKNNNKILIEIKGFEEKNKKLKKFETLKKYANENNFLYEILERSDIEKICSIEFNSCIKTLRKKHKNGEF